MTPNPYPNLIDEGIWIRIRPSVDQWRADNPHEAWRGKVWWFYGAFIDSIQEAE